ncbi:rhodanese domain-containing protein [Colletotrichum higginsianum]|uniref:Rhodanese domain-containing protein n=1 Tax=Colletotrichum higginsianum (strain IMI 349063) TaxID=759273 RepID=H1VK23_COLHI|nr:rhodanese domain-containing protein [Colletotrichum higginsianum]
MLRCCYVGGPDFIQTRDLCDPSDYDNEEGCSISMEGRDRCGAEVLLVGVGRLPRDGGEWEQALELRADGRVGEEPQGRHYHRYAFLSWPTGQTATSTPTAVPPFSFPLEPSLLEHPHTNARLPLDADSREPGELEQTGRIPSAVNIPVATAPESFHISEDDFEDRYGFPRPAKDTELVFYCKAGVRSRAAATLAKEAGWTRVGEYPGSFLDWQKHGGEVETGGRGPGQE